MRIEMCYSLCGPSGPQCHSCIVQHKSCIDESRNASFNPSELNARVEEVLVILV